jgi:hypothetical protein
MPLPMRYLRLLPWRRRNEARVLREAQRQQGVEHDQAVRRLLDQARLDRTVAG